MYTTEMLRLITMLTALHIPYEVTADLEGNPQVWYPTRQNPICDAICHSFSYGGSDGLLEIMGLVDRNDDVLGYQHAEEVLLRIANHYFNAGMRVDNMVYDEYSTEYPKENEEGMPF